MPFPYTLPFVIGGDPDDIINPPIGIVVLPPWQNSKPTAFSIHGGALVAPSVFQFAVDDANGVELQAYANATPLGAGMFEATTYSNAGAPGRRTIRWRMRPYSGFAGYIEWTQPWDTYRVPSPAPIYALISDLRDEGVTEMMIPDARARSLLMLASLEVTRFTGRTFGPRSMSLMLDGRGGSILMFEEPVVGLGDVALGAETVEEVLPAIDPAAYRVYNRHIAEGLLQPDDRENPKLEFRGYSSLPRLTSYDRSRFTTGQQNVRVRGVFGYTDFDGSPTGGIPYLITRATMLIAARLSPTIGNPGSGIGDANSWKVVEEQTRDQRVRFADLGSTAATKSGTSLRGAYTGDPEIDTILSSYARGPRFASA